MADEQRYIVGTGLQRHGNVALGGSPLRLFRLTDAGNAVLDRIAAGDAVARSHLIESMVAAGAIHPDPVGATMTAADVTVVTPTLGPPDHVIDGAIVVDDGSQPPVGTATVRLAENRGPSAARNVGLADVETALVAFVDGDVAVSTDWLDRLLPHFDDDRVALVAPRVRAAVGGNSLLARYEAEHHPLDLGAEPANIRPGTRVSYVPGAAIVCRTDAVRALDGFDTDLRFGEDVDLVWRLVEAGWTCRYEPRSEVRHELRTSWRAWIAQRVGYGSSAAPLAARHRGALTPLRINGWSLTTWLLAAIGRPGLGAALGTGSAAALVQRLPDLPTGAAFRLGAEGNLRAGDQIAAAVRRAWWPALAVASLRSRHARRILLASMAAARSPLRAVDDAVYAVGVWRGVIRERNLGPLVPAISPWPPRRPRPERGSPRRSSRYRPSS
jgi:mycofactocin system glycosyltransferase